MKKILILMLVVLFGCKENVNSTTIFEGEFTTVGSGMSNSKGKETFTVLRVNKDNISVYNQTNTITLKARNNGNTYTVYDGSGTWYDLNLGKNINVYYDGAVTLTDNSLDLVLSFTPNNQKATLLFKGTKVQ